MSCGREEIFGPVLCIKRVNSFEEGLHVKNNSRFANGSVIYTESGHFAREFAQRIHGGMVGVNVGIPVPLRSSGSQDISSRFSATYTAWGAMATSSTPRPRM